MGEKTEGHFHVFVMIKLCREIKITNVEAHVTCFWGAENSVPMKLGGCHVGSARGKFSGVVN
jgi:hypothetical protein